jgi:hypothetical protein
MENKFGVIDLNEKELMECNGGWALSIIALFLTSAEKVKDFVDGIREGYVRSTATP